MQWIPWAIGTKSLNQGIVFVSEYKAGPPGARLWLSLPNLMCFWREGCTEPTGSPGSFKGGLSLTSPTKCLCLGGIDYRWHSWLHPGAPPCWNLPTLICSGTWTCPEMTMLGSGVGFISAVSATSVHIKYSKLYSKHVFDNGAHKDFFLLHLLPQSFLTSANTSM